MLLYVMKQRDMIDCRGKKETSGFSHQLHHPSLKLRMASHRFAVRIFFASAKGAKRAKDALHSAKRDGGPNAAFLTLASRPRSAADRYPRLQNPRRRAIL